MGICLSSKHDSIRDKLLSSEEYSKKVVEAGKIFSLLGEPNRMKIILALMEGELCVYHICEITGAKQSVTSQHLRKLKDSHIVKCRKDSNQVLYSLQDEHIATIIKTTLQHLNCKEE